MAEDRNAGPGFASSAVAVSSGNKGMVVAIVIALLCVLGVGIVGMTTKSKIDAMAQKQAEFQQTSDQRFAEMESRWKATVDSMAARLGTTTQELEEKAAALQKSQRVASSRLSKQQKAINEVNTQVSGVRTDVDSTKTDLGNTKTDLEATKTKLDKTIGDLGVQSGLIALTRDQLEALKRKGERNYYDVTLLKGKAPTPVSNVSLQLKKVDPKHNRFTVNVLADDKVIQKKDRTLAEPMQFYTGKDHQLYELVVFEVAKNEVSGYLSTPKEAPQRAASQQQ